MSETKQAPLTDVVMRGMAKQLAEQFFAFQRARPQVEELIQDVVERGHAQDCLIWNPKHKRCNCPVEMARALESCLESGRQAALGGKAE